MSPILTGVIASGISGNLAVGPSYESIATFTLGAATSSVTFTSIPSTYKHLQIRAVMKCTDSNNMFMQVGNGSIDTGANYSWHQLYGTGSTAYSNGAGSGTFSYIGYNFNTSYPNPSIIDLVDYSSTVKRKSYKTMAGTETNGSGFVQLWGGSWRSTSVIDTIRFTPGSGNFNTNSIFALYGIKG
jgi:hypothetical protein